MLRKGNTAQRIRGPLAAAAIGAFWLASGPAWSQGRSDHGWMMWDSDYGWGGMMGGGLGMVLFWGLIILLIVLAVRGFGSRRDSVPPDHKTPLQILDERYARGEIEKEEYEERRKTLIGS